MKTGTATLPLHGGRAPAWLFQRMVRLSRALATVVADEYGTLEFLTRLSDPFWFQALGCVLGFDWHSSGLTTTTCGALKEALRADSEELGLVVAGGKGATSRKTPQEIEAQAPEFGLDAAELARASRLAAKVDNAGVQDGYQLYHHTFIFDAEGNWCVVQQGMNDATGFARRYHWLSRGLEDFVSEPHAAVCGEPFGPTLNLVAGEGGENRAATADLARTPPEDVLHHLQQAQGDLHLPARHHTDLADVNPRRLRTVLLSTYEAQAADFEALLALPGVGAKSLRALALLAELVHGAPPSWRDPARYSFAHGGKDGHPYPVDRATYDRSIGILEQAIRHAEIGQPERLAAFRRLQQIVADDS